MGEGQKFWPGLGQVNFLSFSHFWFETGFGKFPLKIPNISSIGSKKLLRVGSKRRVVLLFTSGQKYARVGSGPGPSLWHNNTYKNFNLVEPPTYLPTHQPQDLFLISLKSRETNWSMHSGLSVGHGQGLYSVQLCALTSNLQLSVCVQIAVGRRES